MSGEEFAQALAAELLLPAISPEDVAELLSLAGTAAHASERLAAPLCTFLAGRSGRDIAAVHAAVRRLAEERGPG